MTKKITEGNATVQISDELDKSIAKLIQKAAPEAIKVFESSMMEIKADAESSWPVRQPIRIMRNAKGEIVKNEKGQAVVFKNPPSKRSIDKFKVETQIRGGEIVVSFINDASYANMIRMGIDSKGDRSEIFLPLGARVWDNVVFSPVKKAAKRVAEQYADELIKLQKD